MDDKEREEIDFNIEYSRFKVQIYFKNRKAITHYGKEKYDCTVAQIRFGHIKKVVLDREKGLQDCINRIAYCERRYGAYKTAEIFDKLKKTVKSDGTVQDGRMIQKYKNGQLVESEEPFNSDSEKKIETQVIFLENNGTRYFKLRACKPPIDFKKEVAKALHRPG